MFLLFNAEKMPEIVASNLQAYSWSFSHFFLWRKFGIQFDCGEGSAIRLDEHVFRTDLLAMSHSHSDHCRGILTLLEMRSGLKGANDKPLTIVFPKDSKPMDQWIVPARDLAARRNLVNVRFFPIAAGDKMPLQNGRILEAIDVVHEKGEPCLAYRIGHQRKRLKKEYEHLDSKQIQALASKLPRSELEEVRYECELVYSGDTERMEPSFYNGAQVLIHETSFLYPEDADKQKGIHTDLKSLLPSVRDGGVRNLILFHSSRRYELDTLKTEIQKIIEDSSLNCPVILIRGAYNLLTD